MIQKYIYDPLATRRRWVPVRVSADSALPQFMLLKEMMIDGISNWIWSETVWGMYCSAEAWLFFSISHALSYLALLALNNAFFSTIEISGADHPGRFHICGRYKNNINMSCASLQVSYPHTDTPTHLYDQMSSYSLHVPTSELFFC